MGQRVFPHRPERDPIPGRYWVASLLAHESPIGVVNLQENQFDGQPRSKSHRQDAAIGQAIE